MPGESATKETLAELYGRVFSLLRPRTPAPSPEVDFGRFANVNNFIEWKDNRLIVRISDILLPAPESVHEALAWILVGKLLRKPVPPVHSHRYRQYLNRRDVTGIVEKVRRDRGQKRYLHPDGKHYNLVEIFENQNARFFWGLMARPDLGWSLKPSYTILGHYDSAHHAIVLSSLLDRADVPALAVDYVMYHEMLHLRHPVERRGARRCVHTAEFREAEERFPEIDEAKKLIVRICNDAWLGKRRA